MPDNPNAKVNANTNEAPEPKSEAKPTEELNSHELDQISGGNYQQRRK